MASEEISALMVASAKDREAAFEEGRRAGLEEAARAIADLEDDYGEFAAIVALDRAQRSIRALAQTSTPEGEECDERNV